MAHEIKFDADMGVVAVHYTGTISSREIIEVKEEILQSPGFHQGLKAICDFRDCDIAIGPEEINELVAFAKRHDLEWGDARWAMIADKDYIYGLARIFIAKTNEMHVETRVFRDAPEADDWLGIGISLEEALIRIFASTPSEPPTSPP